MEANQKPSKCGQPGDANPSGSDPNLERVPDAVKLLQDVLLAELVSEGMGEAQARKAVATHYAVALMQIENLRHALPTETLRPANRGAWLHVAIRDGYGPTQGYSRHLAGKKDTKRRQAASERRKAAQQAESEAKRVVELELTPDEIASLNQKARNCVHPEWRSRSEVRNVGLINANYERLLAGENVMEFAAWPVRDVEDKKSESQTPTDLGQPSATSPPTSCLSA